MATALRRTAQPAANPATMAQGTASYVALSTLKLWEENPRQNDEGVPALARILALNGQRSPVVAWSKNSVIYKGNTTYKAMRLLHEGGLAKHLSADDRAQVAGAIAALPTADERSAAHRWRNEFEEAVHKGYIWAVLQPFPSERAAIAYAISDNKASEWSDWNDEVLARLQTTQHFTPELIGFTPKELEQLEANVGSFAAQTYEQVAEAFEKQKVGKKDVLWFWFEVDNKAALDFVKARYSRTNEKGKRLHRELDWELLAGVMGYKAPLAKLPARKVLRMKDAGNG